MNELALPDEPNDIATTGTEPAAPPIQQPQAGPESSALLLWAQEARQAAAVAQSIARTSFAGALKGKPEEVTAVILAGNELGLKPMAALKSIDVIQGTPALRAHAMRGLVQAAGHEIELVDSGPEHCVMRGRRKGAENWQTVQWSVERAAQLGLTGKDQWKKQPQTMLVARATGELCRLIAADVLHGMPYAAEEIEGTAHAEIVPDRARLSVAEITASGEDGAA
ncbi:hypothetical protein [Streptomyces odontomachi]|uniref:hypothetical protein n=1 Tax=Streptomyces odontomachi TaxID=2944940 RepID=UPI00210C1B8B|nr:hypothetical protein [Streptomyces sp. ODS25]